jgi:hypothetical protein
MPAPRQGHGSRAGERARTDFVVGGFGVRGVAPDEVDAVARRVLVEVGDDHDLLLVVVATQLIDEVASGGVPAAHDDVVLEPGRSQTLALLQEEIDDHRDEGPGDHPEHGDPEQDQQPADHPAGR